MVTRRVVPMLFVLAVLGMSLGMSGNGCQSTDSNKNNPTPTEPPALTNLVAAGTLTQKQMGTLTISCKASGADADIVAVTADLSCMDSQLVFLQAGQDGVSWTWSGPVTPSCCGRRTIPVTVVDTLGQLVTGAATIDVAPLPDLNQPPLITDLRIGGNLVNGLPGRISVSCTAADPDLTVASVTADLSALGGGLVALRVSGSLWTWVGTVTPMGVGNQSITLTATDNQGASSTADATAQVMSAPPMISNVQVASNLIAGQEGSVTISCDATDSDGAVESVTANLTAIGGGIVFLNGNGSSWSWTGAVTPVAEGYQSVTVTATDDSYATALASVTIRVLPTPALITNVKVGGLLTIGQAGQMSVSCDATNPNGTIQSVTANLGSLGGGIVSLQTSGSSWSWSGAVTPLASGSRKITLTATNSVGGTATADAMITVYVSPAPLAGAWRSTDDPMGMGLTTTLIIGQDGVPVAEFVSMSPFGQPLAYQVIPDGLEHVAFDLSGPTVVQQTPFRFALDESGVVAVDQTTTLTISSQGILVLGGSGQLVDATTMTLTADVGSMQGVTLTFTKLGAVPPLWPYVKTASVTGALQHGNAGTVSLSCDLVDVGNEITTVTADLTGIGGQTVSLTKDVDGTWKAQGVAVDPQIAGSTPVLFKASDASDPRAGLNVRVTVQ